MIRLLIVDGLGLLTKQFKDDLDAQADIAIVRIADTVVGAIEHHEEVRPDALLMDLLVPGGTGVAAAKLVHQVYPDAAVVLLCGERPENSLVAEFGEVTIAVPITCSPAALVDIVIEAAARGKQRSRRTGKRGGVANPRAGSSSGHSGPGLRLSAREHQLLQLVSLGLTSASIANELGLSVSTVRTYTQRLLERLDSHSRTEAVRKAIRLGLIDP